MHRRDLRGLISRPTVREAKRYRASIDSHIDNLLSKADEELLDEIEPILILGFHHEQQHQELLVTDIKHVFAQNPLYPVFREDTARHSERPEERRSTDYRPNRFLDFEETIVAIGHEGRGFAYDNEGPRHRALVPAFSLASRPVTNGEDMAFIEDNGYARPEVWLSLGWMTLNEQRWEAPLYWTKHDGRWWNFTLSGFRPVDESEPVTHVSYFEADAYANWAGARLATEFEWERAALDCPIEGNFVDDENFHPRALSNSENNGVFAKCLATFGNGRAARTHLIQVIGRRRAHSVNTTASSCATSTFYAAVPARLRAAIFVEPIAISSNRRNAGSLQGSGSHAIHNESVRRDR